jgi:hypothetical protein
MEAPTTILPLEMFGVVQQCVELHWLCGVGYELVDITDAWAGINPRPTAAKGIFVVPREDTLFARGNSFLAGVTACRIAHKVAAQPRIQTPRSKCTRNTAPAVGWPHQPNQGKIMPSFSRGTPKPLKISAVPVMQQTNRIIKICPAHVCSTKDGSGKVA